MKIGVIGNGYVGNAVAKGFTQLGDDVAIWDCLKDRATHTLLQTCSRDIVFCCVPTPTEEGQQDISNVKEVISSIAQMNPKAIVIMKSTVLPGTSALLEQDYGVTIISNPEFLTARTAEQDFQDPMSIVIGHTDVAMQKRVSRFYEERFPEVPLLVCSSQTEAEFIKYARNTFFALKVGYMNQLYDLAASLGVPWEPVKNGMVASGWVSPMHTLVPGPDGKRGFGGACLPKDSEALVAFSWEQQEPLTILEAALIANKRVRED